MSLGAITEDRPLEGHPPALIEILPLMITYAVGFMSATYLPVWVSAAATRYAVPVSRVGLIGSYELCVVALATIVTAAVRSPGATRAALVVGLSVAIVFNFLTAISPSIGVFTGALTVAALANGFLLAEVNGRAAASAVPGRVFTGQLFVMMAFAVLFFAAAPRLLTLLGPGATFIYCAAASVIALISTWKLPRAGMRTADGPAKSAFRLVPAGVLLLAAPTLLFVAMNIVWPYLSSEAARVGVSFSSYSKALSGGAFVTLVGPIAADRLLRSRISWFFVITMGIGTLLACAALITAIDSSSAYLVGVILLPVCLLVVVPFYLALLLRSDPSGKLVAVSSAFFMVGTAIGPGVGGLALSVRGLSGLAFASILTPLLAFLATWDGARQLSLRKG